MSFKGLPRFRAHRAIFAALVLPVILGVAGPAFAADGDAPVPTPVTTPAPVTEPVTEPVVTPTTPVKTPATQTPDKTPTKTPAKAPKKTTKTPDKTVKSTTPKASTPTKPAAVPTKPDSLASVEGTAPVDITALQAASRAAQDELTTITRDYETGMSDLANVKAEAQAANDAATRADQEVTAARTTIREYAADAYQNPVPSQIGVIFNSNDPTDSLTAYGYLSEAGKNQATAIKTLEAKRAEAHRLRAEANSRQADVQKKTDALAAKLEEARTKAQQASQTLSAAVNRVPLSDMPSVPSVTTLGKGTTPSSLSGYCTTRSLAIHPPTSKSWGGYPNGLIPASALCALGVDSHKLRSDAANAFFQMDAAYFKAFNAHICITDSYRSYSEQVDVYARKPNLAAIPGTSNHGWGLAMDLGCGINNFGTKTHNWMAANAPSFGWVHPGWAEPFGSRPEPWHWEFGSIS